MSARRIKSGALRFAARKLGPASAFSFRLADAFVKAYKNFDYDIRTNGESLLVRRMASHPVETVFDVGANAGEWSLLCAGAFPGAAVHAFEIVPSTFERLHRAVGRSASVKANPVGLSDQAGVVQIHFAPRNDTVSSLVAGPEIHDLTYTKLDVEVTTGDEYCASNAIDRIDLLKIDVEGAENRVLNGFSRMLAQGRVSVVQFEYGLANIFARYLLADHYAFFEQRGYRVGKLMPDGVAFKDYAPADEDFIGPNFVAVQRSRADLIETLGRRR